MLRDLRRFRQGDMVAVLAWRIAGPLERHLSRNRRRTSPRQSAKASVPLLALPCRDRRGGFGDCWRNCRLAAASAVAAPESVDPVRGGARARRPGQGCRGRQVARRAGGYAELAGFEEAAVLAKSGHHKQAIAVYSRIAATNPHPLFRDLAVLLSAMQQMQQDAAKTVVDKLKPLTAPGNPWRPSALELTALAELETGDKSGARGLYKQLSVDPAAPPGLRARAAEMVSSLTP